VAAKTTAEELERLWEWSENIREEVGALSDAIAKLAAKDLPSEGEDEEEISNVSNRARNVYLGSVAKISEEAAVAKARKMKAEALEIDL